MRAQELYARLNQAWLDQIYGFSYHRCSTTQEAEDLCSEIGLALLHSFSREPDIRNFEAFVWRVARHVYADHCEKRRRNAVERSPCGLFDSAAAEDTIGEYQLAEEERQLYKEILSRMAFLAKIYREVMVLHYLDGMSIPAIAQKLGISETCVKQRLFSARETIRKGGHPMYSNIPLKPVCLDFIGTGNPIGNDPRTKAERVLSQNLVYLCKDRPMSAKALSEALSVPMPYIEDELEIQCSGENGRYGLLRRLDNGKYIANILIFDPLTWTNAATVYKKHLDPLCTDLAQCLASHRAALLNFPYLAGERSVSFILWALISRVVWNLEDEVNHILSADYFPDTPPAKRNFSTIAFAHPADQPLEIRFYGCDGINAQDVCGYSRVFMSNIYGRRIREHFHCGHNISTDGCIRITLRAIGGLTVSGLTEEEQELASKSIACGYLQREGDQLRPRILVLREADSSAFYGLADLLTGNLQPLAAGIARELATQMNTALPAHLKTQSTLFNIGASVGLLGLLIEACIQKGLLCPPPDGIGGEGVLLTVE